MRNKTMILVECDPDECFVKSMGFSRKKIKHESGKGNVLKKLKTGPMTIGIIDEDPHSTQPSEMDRYRETDKRDSIRLLVRDDNPEKKVIQISPYLEHWLINRAKRNRISLEDYDLPDDPKDMHDITHIERNKNFHEFLNKLINKDDEIKTIRTWISEAIK